MRQRPTKTIIEAYTITDADCGYRLICNSETPFTVSLHTATGRHNFEMEIDNIGAGTVTCGGQTISQNSHAHVGNNNGTAWVVVVGQGSLTKSAVEAVLTGEITTHSHAAYTLPQATSSALGGIKASEKTSAETVDVKIDTASGILYVPPADAATNGLPAGGTTGQVLAKVDGTDYNAQWVTPSGGAATVYGPDVLIVAGGGGGGGGIGGGGGGGGVLYLPSLQLDTGNYIVNVGAGGTASSSSSGQGGNGGNSSFGKYFAIGGGGGGANADSALAEGKSGGSGGGSGESPYSPGAESGQGKAGGNANNNAPSYGSGGGGGTTTAGGDGTGTAGGTGGQGFTSSISGSSVVYGSGGGGAVLSGTPGNGGTNGGKGGIYNSTNATAGVTNTGGGGGGNNNVSASGVGGSGVVIVRYLTGTISATGGAVTTDGGYTVHKFTSNGTLVVS